MTETDAVRLALLGGDSDEDEKPVVQQKPRRGKQISIIARPPPADEPEQPTPPVAVPAAPQRPPQMPPQRPAAPQRAPQRPQEEQRRPQNDLAQLLKDVCSLLDSDKRSVFRKFVQKLKNQRDAGEIESLTRALLNDGPQVVGRVVWRQALDMQKRRQLRPPSRPRPPAPPPVAPPPVAPPVAPPAVVRQPVAPFVVPPAAPPAAPPAPPPAMPAAEVDPLVAYEVLQPQQPGLTADEEIAVAAPAGALSEEVQRHSDLLKNSDLFDAREEESRSRAKMTALESATPDFLSVAACLARLNAAADAVATPAFKAAGRPAQSFKASRGAAEALAHATRLFLHDALQALVVLSRRRRNDEAYRLAAHPKSALAVEWNTLDLDAAVQRDCLRCEYKDARYQAMLDHEISWVQRNCDQRRTQEKSEPRTWAEAARASRKRALVRAGNLPLPADIIANTEETVKRVKLEESRVKDHHQRPGNPPPGFYKQSITKQDVLHYLESRMTFNALLL